ncbi:hypothetical protein ACHAWC_002870 [Mediolabrus comicus]
MIDTMMMNQQEVVEKTNNYPRTGKRGVPQQFPRKLFLMLDMESNRLKSGGCVSWSSCGRAFHIVDVTAFSKEILPTYFKTSKFSSFQRNLNLYGFNKINKGVYSHPQFRRGDKLALTQLRKRVKAASSRSPTKITITSRTVSPTQELWRDAPLHQQYQPHHQHHGDPSSERLSILAQAVRVAMVLEAGGSVSKENSFPTFYC